MSYSAQMVKKILTGERITADEPCNMNKDLARGKCIYKIITLLMFWKFKLKIELTGWYYGSTCRLT